jgi:hypothetical protein
MSTLAPDRVGSGSGPGVDRHTPRPPGWPERVAGWLKSDSNSRVWVRRKAVAAWMNILIAGAAAVTVVTAGLMTGQHWPEPATWGISALKLFTLWCLAFLPGWLYVRRQDQGSAAEGQAGEREAMPGGQAGEREAMSGAQARLKLRRVGIRTATDLLKAFSTEECQPSGGPPQRTFCLPAGVKPPLPEGQLRLLVAVLSAEPGLAPVWNWQRNGVPLSGVPGCCHGEHQEC